MQTYSINQFAVHLGLCFQAFTEEKVVDREYNSGWKCNVFCHLPNIGNICYSTWWLTQWKMYS